MPAAPLPPLPRAPGATLPAPRGLRAPPGAARRPAWVEVEVEEDAEGWTSYEVRAGDESLTAIAWLAYMDGSLWPKLWMANRRLLSSPDRIEPGQVIRIPPKAPLTAAERAGARAYRHAGRRSRP